MSSIRFIREISPSINRLVQHFPALVLTGARQTGKTTLLRGLFPQHHYVSLDLPADAALAEEDPSEFLRRYPPPLLVDEVQYAPGLFRHIKVAVDRDRDTNGQFILTGSQKFTLMKEVSDSLAGRCGVLELEGLSLAELGPVAEQFVAEMGFGALLSRGFMPQLWKDPDLASADFYRGYLATYLERDVRQILNVSSLRDFDRFMRACAIRSGQLLNKTELGKEVGVTAKTINDWLSVLEASNQISLLEPWFRNVGKRLTKSPKLYFNDPGLLCFLLGLTRESVADSHLVGAIWETFIYSELRKFLKVTAPEATIWFYRDQSKEVDFVIDKEGTQVLAEAKWTELPRPDDVERMKDLASLLAISDNRHLVFCRAQPSFPLGDNAMAVNGMQIREFL